MDVANAADAPAQARTRPDQRTGPDVVVGVLRDGDRVLLGHRSPERAWYPNVWDLPGGHVEAGETPVAALVRELREELGIEAARPGSAPLAVIGLGDVVLWAWLVETWDGEVRNAAPDEHDALAWVSAGELAGLALAHPVYLRLLTEVLGESTPAGG